MLCDSCGNDNAYRLRFSSGGVCCDNCGSLGRVTVPDVYFREPYLDPHLVDYRKPEQKDGIWVESRKHKAELMDRLGVREAGDRRGGMRLEDKFAMRREREKGH